MSSFSKLSRWPVGYFRAYSRWLLNQRREIPARVALINAEVERIGFITVAYRGEKAEDGSVTLTEERLGFSVPEGTTLARLVQAYIAQGGNPFNISPFWMPGRTKVIGLDGDGNPIRVEQYPHGGIMSLKSASPGDPHPVVVTDDDGEEVVITSGFGGYPGGQPNSEEFNYATRLGTQAPLRNHDMVMVMRKMRDWANQDIKTKLQDIEWRIVKQMDLREQLEFERDEILVQAFGGALDGVAGMATQRFNPDLSVQSKVQEMNELLFEMGDDGTVTAYRANADVDTYDFAFEDLPSEVGRDPLG